MPAGRSIHDAANVEKRSLFALCSRAKVAQLALRH
jgi:hypothetical protein